MISLNDFLDDGYLLLITCLFSIITCSMIVFIYILNKDRSYGFGLIVILCLSNLGMDLIILIDILKYNITK
jgi:hypothetical protein